MSELRYRRGAWCTDAEYSDALTAADLVRDEKYEREPWERCGRCKDTAPHAWFYAVGSVCTLSPLYTKDWIRKPKSQGRKAA